MIQLDLTEAEKKILVEVLGSDLSDLRMEISDTDRMEFREMLKGRKEVIQKTLDMLQGVTEPVAAR